jgi:polysaccharide biosynthesis transport protein
MNKEEFNLQDYLKILKKRRWTIATAFSIVFFAIVAFTFLATPQYKATAQIYIDPGMNSQFAIQQVQYSDNTSYLQTQIGILKSESIARKVIDRLGLDAKAEPGLFAGFLGMFVSDDANSDQKRKDRAIKDFLEDLKVDSIKNSNLVKVSYEDKDPVLAAKVANTTVQMFIEQNLEMKVAPAREAMSWLNDKLGDIKSKMTESTSSLQDFKRDKDLIVTGDNQNNISLQSLSDLTAKALMAESKRMAAQVKYEQVQRLGKSSDGYMTVPEVLNNGMVQNLKAQETATIKDIADQSKRYGDKHPKMLRLQSDLQTVRDQIKDEVALIISSIKNDYDAAVSEEQSVKRALARQKSEAMSYERRSTEYELMRKDIVGSGQIYDTVLKKFQESNLMGNINMSNVQLLDMAYPPATADHPKKLLNIILGIFFGLFSGIGFAFLFEYFDNTYKSPEELEEETGLPFLGPIPTDKALTDLRKQEDTVLVAPDNSPSTEAFRNVRGNLLLATGDETPKVVQISSSVHSEGKTTFAVNFAATMAMAGEKVLLIDGDMRKPRLHKVFNMANGQGLSNLLANQAKLGGLIKPTGISNLSIIISGPVSPNPGELLASKTMREALETLKGRYDRIIIDCPPMLGIVDAFLLSPLTDGIIIVVRSGRTGKDLIRKAAKSLEGVKARVLGVVLNDVGKGTESYYYNYSYYYSNEKK